MIRASILCSDRRHHVWPMLAEWSRAHKAHLTDKIEELQGGEILFLISCSQIVPREVRDFYAKTLVIHESDVPKGRGWSPMAWQILEGRDMFTVSLIEAGDRVDTGAVWAKRKFWIPLDALSEEINRARDARRRELMDFAMVNFGKVTPEEQQGEATYYGRRTPEMSRIDPDRSIASQFDLLRICEPRFPAFFDLRGHRYEITLRKSA